jgi:hypothetical protein
MRAEFCWENFLEVIEKETGDEWRWMGPAQDRVQCLPLA